MVLLEGIFIAATCVAVWHAQQHLPKPKVPAARSSLLRAAAFVAVFCVAAATLNGPGLSPTHNDVLSAKLFTRDACSRTAARTDALKAIYNSTVGKQLARTHRTTEAHSQLEYLAHLVLFNTGPLLTVAPFLLLLAVEALRLACSSRRRGGPAVVDGRTGRGDCSSSQAVLDRALPAVNVVCAVSAAAYLVVNFALPELRGAVCLLVSGHWFVFVMSLLCGCMVWAHLRHVCVPGSGPSASASAVASPSPLLLFYSVYLAGYCALALRVLWQTQRFFHDDREAVAGIAVGFLCVPVALAAAFLVVPADKGKD